MKYDENHRKLVDIMFEVVGLVHHQDYQEHFNKMSHEDLMAWVAKQLDGCGFKTIPIGASWGSLRE